MGKNLSPAHRIACLKETQHQNTGGLLALAEVRRMAQVFNPEVTDFLVREIIGYSVTRIFHAPMHWPDGSTVSWARVPNSTPEYTATLTGRLRQCLECGSALDQFAKDPGLRETVAKVEERSADRSTFLVVEEQGPISGCRMERGECWPGPDGGRDGVAIFKAGGGAWPEFTEKVERDTTLLASLRTMTKAAHPFELHARSVCYFTDQGETAHPVPFTVNIAYGGPRVTSPIPGGAVGEWADQLGEHGERLLAASTDPAVAELLSALRLDEARHDEYFRLWYLRLWQALRDVGKFCKSPTVRAHLEALRHQPRWQALTNHRNAIAHWETGRTDYGRVGELHAFAVEVTDFIAGTTHASSGGQSSTDSRS